MVSGDEEASRDLARFLTGDEAHQLADRIASGSSLTQAMVVIGPARRQRVQELLRAAGLGIGDRPRTIAVLRAIEGAHDHQTSLTPLWTAPANLAQSGGLTTSVAHFVAAARESVVCSTYNFQRSSVLWEGLAAAAARPEVAVRVYIDTEAADKQPTSWSPTTEQIATELGDAVVFRTIDFDGRRVRNHAKFIAVDHQYLIITSANFSRSAEWLNVEFGLQLHDPNITQGAEQQMRAMEGAVFERVVIAG